MDNEVEYSARLAHLEFLLEIWYANWFRADERISPDLFRQEIRAAMKRASFTGRPDAELEMRIQERGEELTLRFLDRVENRIQSILEVENRRP